MNQLKCFVKRFLPESLYIQLRDLYIKFYPSFNENLYLLAYKIINKMGFHLIRDHYYSPIPLKSDITDDFFERCSPMVGIEMNDTRSLEFLKQLFPSYLEEFRGLIPLHKTSKTENQFYLINSNYMAVDAHVYYSFIRHFKPKRIIEIGGGNSTLLASIACLQNQAKDSHTTNLTVIEPYPRQILRDGFPGFSKLIESKVQQVDLNLFASLEAGDILFIDSSHVLRSGGDVQFEYLEILPRLAPGVLVHIHDISLPKSYPSSYYEHKMFWNEQYLLQAFLLFNSRFEVFWPGNYMMVKYPKEVCSVFPEFHVMREHFPQSEPTAFWIRVRS